MILLPKKSTIVVVGFWNRMIFNPKMVACEIFNVEEIETLVAIDPSSPTIYQNKDTLLQITDKRIVLTSRKPEKECLKKTEKMACTILEFLPRTPISAIGVNFGFRENEPEDNLLELFGFADEADIGACEWEIASKRIVRTLIHDEMRLNFTLEQPGPDHIEIHANFDFSVEKPEQAIGKIKDRTCDFYDSILKLLNEVYKLQIEEPIEEEQ
jgi:hypothetical protein